jgi:glutathione synthase
VILEFPELIAPTLVSADKEQIRGFLQQQQRIVLKPLNGKGGEGIFVIDLSDKNFSSTVEQLTNYGARPIMAQTYIPEIETEGDKRIILVNGEIAGALLRKPSASDHRANMAAGGTFASTEITAAERRVAETLKPFCIEQGIVLAGIDLIGGKLTEINITSPTCLQEINRLNPGKEKIETGLIKSLSVG